MQAKPHWSGLAVTSTPAQRTYHVPIWHMRRLQNLPWSEGPFVTLASIEAPAVRKHSISLFNTASPVMPAPQMRTTTECSYLAGSGPEGMGPLQHIALFKSHDISRDRGVYALVMPMEQRSAHHAASNVQGFWQLI